MLNESRTTSERALAGSMTLDSRAIDAAIAEGLESRDISDPDAKAVISAAMIRHASGLPVDVLTIQSDSGLTWDALEAMIETVPTAAHAGYYAERVTAYASLDRFKILGEWIVKKAAKASPDDHARIAAEISAATDRAMQVGRVVESGSLRTAAVSWLDRMTAPDEMSVMLDWPVPSITRHMGRVDRELIWIVAQPSLGKTAMILQWAIMLGGQGHTVAIASLESQRDALGSRAIANVGPLDNFTIRQRRAGSETIAAAYDAAHRIPDTIRIADNKMTIDQVYAWGKSEVRRGAVMLIIDNTRHIHVRGNVDRVNEVAEISAKTKQLRDETHVPVVVLHHSKIDAKSGAEDVSWCKDIEKDADVMVFLKADPDNSVAPNTENDPGVWAVRWFVKKNRESRADYEILLRFLKQYQLFEEWDKPAGAQRNDYDTGY